MARRRLPLLIVCLVLVVAGVASSSSGMIPDSVAVVNNNSNNDNHAIAAAADDESMTCHSNWEIGSDRPHCLDPAMARDVIDETTRRHRGRRRSEAADAHHHPNQPHHEPHGKFKRGDIVELYNPDSNSVQIVFPSIVHGYYYHAPPPSTTTTTTTDDGSGVEDEDTAAAAAAAMVPAENGYRVTKTTDGREVRDLDEKLLHLYIPYTVGDEALCNIGEFIPPPTPSDDNESKEQQQQQQQQSQSIIVKCTVENYAPAAKHGALVLQGQYTVRIHDQRKQQRGKEEEYVTILPVWKLQRRLVAKQK